LAEEESKLHPEKFENEKKLQEGVIASGYTETPEPGAI
jgi:hypothetical protein